MECAGRPWELCSFWHRDHSPFGTRAPEKRSAHCIYIGGSCAADRCAHRCRFVASTVCMVRGSLRPCDCPWPQSRDRKSTRLNSSHVAISYAVFCLKKKKHELLM